MAWFTWLDGRGDLRAKQEMHNGTKEVSQSVSAYLNGFGQIMLQESRWTGLLFLVGIAVGSWVMCVGALLGGLVGVLSARWLKLASAGELRRGLYGFNAALVGIAVAFYFPVSGWAVLLVVVGSVVASLLMRGFAWVGVLPAYTAPFVITTWVIIYAGKCIGLAEQGHVGSAPHGELVAMARGVGQVMFQDHWISGGVFLAGVALASMRAAAWAVLGAGMGSVLGRGFGLPDDLAMAGIFGFNAVLAAIALDLKFPRGPVAPLMGMVLSVLLTGMFLRVGTPALTAPFILSTWIVMAGARVMAK